MSSAVENGVEFVKRHQCWINFIQGQNVLEQDLSFVRFCRAYNQITNNGFHIFGAQPLQNGQDLCNFQLRNVICVFRITPLSG